MIEVNITAGMKKRTPYPRLMIGTYTGIRDENQPIVLMTQPGVGIALGGSGKFYILYQTMNYDEGNFVDLPGTLEIRNQ